MQDEPEETRPIVGPRRAIAFRPRLLILFCACALLHSWHTPQPLPATDLAAQGSSEGDAPASAPLDRVQELIEDGRYAEAEAQARPLLAASEFAHGADSLQAAEVLELLVEALWRGGKAEDPESRALAERALAIQEKALGPDHADVSPSLNNLAILLYLRGDYAGAKPLYERALAIDEKALGPNHADIVPSLNNLAVLLQTTRRRPSDPTTPTSPRA